MIFDYMDKAALLFQNYPAATILQCCVEWLCFLWYASALPQRNWNRMTKMLIHIAFFGASIALHLQNYWIGRYFPLYMLLCVGFLWLMTELSLPRVIFKICPFGLGMEFSRLLCRDGLLTLLLALFPETLPGLASILISVAAYFLLFSFTILWMRKATLHFEKLEVNAIQLIGFVFPLALYVIVRQYVFYYMNLTGLTFPQWGQLELLQLAILACAELETMAAGQMVTTQIERNNLLEKQLLAEKSQQQYIAQMQSIDAVNRRYHDLRHYLTAMETMNASEFSESVKAIREEVEAYECMQKTGNNTLDILLSERIRECQKKGIRLVPYIDGRQIDFIQVLDLCVIFGNAMDNAIEATETLKYVNMKEISIKIGVSEQLLVLHFHNYYDGTLHTEGDQLLTRKKDKAAHGYGLENIRETVRKYNGTIAHEANGSEFSLNILIPIPDARF